MAPIWNQFDALIPPRPERAHPLGCHRPRIPDRIVFGYVVAALVHGSGYERIAEQGCCSDRTIRRRVREWADAGLAEKLFALAVAAYDKMIGLDLSDVAVDGCITKAPCGGEAAGRSPVDRGKQGLKRSTATDAVGVPLHVVCAGANRHDAPLLGLTLAGAFERADPPPDAAVHLDRGYAGASSRAVLDDLGVIGDIARKGVPAPIQAGRRWVIERTHAWMNAYGKLRRCTEKQKAVVDFYLFLAAAFVTVRCLIREARIRYRWPNRPTTRRLK